MATFKCTFILDYVSNSGVANATISRNAGNSESLYTAADDIATVRTRFLALCSARALLLPNGSAVKGQRYQQVDPTAAANSSGVRYPGGSGQTAGGADDALNLKITAADTINSRNYGLHFLPDIQMQNGEYAGADPFPANLAAFAALLSSGVWRFKGLNLANPKYDIVSISDAGLVVTVQNNGIVTGDTVRIYSAVSLTSNEKFSGDFKVVSTSGNNFTLSNWHNGPVVLGKVRKIETIYPVIGSVGTPLASSRKPGRPSGGYRGRRSKRRR